MTRNAILARRSVRNRRGQGLVEYALLVAGVAMVSIVGVSMMGHKTSDLIGTVASILPGSHDDDNGVIQVGNLVETGRESNGMIGLNTSNQGGATDPARRLDTNLGFSDGTNTDGTTFVDDSAPTPVSN